MASADDPGMMKGGSYPLKLAEESRAMKQIDNFSPSGLTILVVDDDPLCRIVLERMLRQCNYKVATCSQVSQAISMVMKDKDRFDLVMSDVYLPDEDGFKLLEIVGLGLDLPVIMMSANGETGTVMKGITHGACDYLIKPIRIEELRNIWQHVVRRRGREYLQEELGECDDHDMIDSPEMTSKKRKDSSGGDFSDEVIDDISSLKRARVHWTVQLHQQFVAAVNQVGIDKAVPKKIVEVMKVQGLSRENVASHLQKYRLYLKRLSGIIPEAYPVASFQADKDSISGRTMHMQSGGKGRKGMNLGVGVSSSVGVGRALDQGTLKSLQQYRAHQQKLAANRAQVLGGIGILSPKVSNQAKMAESRTGLKSGLQRMTSVDMGILWKAQREQVLDENEKYGINVLENEPSKRFNNIDKEVDVVLDPIPEQHSVRQLSLRHSRTQSMNLDNIPLTFHNVKPATNFPTTQPVKSMLQEVDELRPMEDISWAESSFNTESALSKTVPVNIFDNFAQEFGNSSLSAATTDEVNRQAFASTKFGGAQEVGIGNEDFFASGSTDISDYLIDDFNPQPR
ncbi:hypothetical protein KI387_013411 [Taxus chinensis]|uniref:Two-component response regulator n=1 Tax=Taxus chinensis TaxID=29808 RepID=A0AA38CN62_TAXCH|nr:hypothetical protein KI387_013411 [Taxus chinensis]